MQIESSAVIRLLLTCWLAASTVTAAPSDARLRDAMRLHALELVNRERTAAGLRPLALDGFTSGLADRFCEQQIKGRFAGHYAPDGTAPYMRYSWSGTRDMLRENVASWSANYPFAQTAIPDLVGRSHRTMLEERPPDDGHRRAILDPHATHMGFGIAWEGNELRFAQVILRRHIEWTAPVPAEVRPGEPLPELSGRTRGDLKIDSISVHWEPPLEPLTRRQLSRSDYTLPGNRRDFTPARAPRGGGLANAARRSSAGELIVERDGRFRFTPPLDRGDGVYTLLIWVRPPGGEPFAAGLASFRHSGERRPRESER